MQSAKCTQSRCKNWLAGWLSDFNTQAEESKKRQLEELSVSNVTSAFSVTDPNWQFGIENDNSSSHGRQEKIAERCEHGQMQVNE
ncbi:hypothetical protein T10_10131 [Trichinella papuae]|uniref:Uncharacterized protein n=1 Tax=Trichinella papuae TaxID=268474 RepID=A0A0V1MAY5_9BILA|nr:hypothetical protein T10_10131 [Trichinella papuae]